jgi:hypothetical protein
LKNIEALDGQTVLVRGWLKGCHGGFDCQIGPDGAVEYRESATIDFVRAMETELGKLDGSEVILHARVTAECSGEEICTDRGPDLVPLKIERILVRRQRAIEKGN